ncbi:MAG: 1,4-alpha-glucan branching protein GlgB, partial [Bacteroidota bacterium]
FYGSWGYQLTGYYATTSRYGSPQDFKEMIDAFHAEGIGVILDWVPSHFPGDAHGLYEFDGTHLYEHADPRKGFHPDWKSYIFNYGRNEVRAFLISNALYWLKEFHIDGLRVDAVASMLYLDYSREAGEWIPNEYGGNENLEAISFLKEMNEAAYGAIPDIITIAEESTSWPMVSKPTYLGGLGFGQKWMMGWMHDTLEYFKKDSIHRQYHQNEITFSVMYAFTENFMLPLSHDEVVHGKGPLIARMPGDEWQRFANLRLMYGLMYAHPGTKLLFMGGEFGQTREWKHEMSLDWHLLEYDVHKGVQNWVRDLNKFYTSNTALYEQGFLQEGFEWVDYSDHKNSVITFLRKGKDENDVLLVVCNFTPQLLNNYLIGVPQAGQWKEEMNSDAKEYFGSGVLNSGIINSSPAEMHGREQAINIHLPPLGITIFSYQGDNATGNMGS